MESRRTQRRPVYQGAWIFPGGGAPLIPCIMLDLSAEGARLKLDPTIALPAEFILVLSRDRRLNRRSRMIWREDNLLGVQFVSQRSIGPERAQRPRRFEIHVPSELIDDPAFVAAPAVEAPALAPDPPNEPPRR